MHKEKWNEFCFILSDNIKTNISEYSFEQKAIQALSVLGWKEFSGNLDIRPSFQFGSVNRITPDVVVKFYNN